MKQISKADLAELTERGFEPSGERWTGKIRFTADSVKQTLIWHGEIGWEAKVSVRRPSTYLEHTMPDGQHECSLRSPFAPPTDDRLDVVLDWLDGAAELVGQMINKLCPR